MAPEVAFKINAIYEFLIHKDGKPVKRWGKLVDSQSNHLEQSNSLNC